MTRCDPTKKRSSKSELTKKSSLGQLVKLPLLPTAGLGSSVGALLQVALEVGLLGEPLAADGADCVSALAAGELVPADLSRRELARAVGALLGPAVAGLVGDQVLLEDATIADGAVDFLRLSPAFPPLLEGELRSRRGGGVFVFFFCIRLLILELLDLFD